MKVSKETRQQRESNKNRRLTKVQLRSIRGGYGDTASEYG
jgi:hypothetical protein